MQNDYSNLVETKSLEQRVFETLGYASMCWSETPKGKFESTKAMEAGKKLMKHINTDVPHAVSVLCKALHEDPEFFYGWQANIAMNFVDEAIRQDPTEFQGERKKWLQDVANEAAKNFLNILIKPTITK